MKPPPGAVLFLAVVVAAPSAVATPASAAGASPIDGRWHAAMTRADLLRTGEVDAPHAGQLYGPWTVEFRNGRFELRNERTGGRGHGTFTVAGGGVRFVFASGVGIRPMQSRYARRTNS